MLTWAHSSPQAAARAYINPAGHRPTRAGSWKVSAPCQDLLARLLVANPNERMSMEEIKEHSWFLEDLPEGALAMNDWYLQSRPVYDQACSLLPHAVLPALGC